MRETPAVGDGRGLSARGRRSSLQRLIETRHVNRTFRRAVMRRVSGKRERQMLTAAIRASAWW